MSTHQAQTYSDGTKEMANRVLDAAKAGLNISADRINWALRVTGDLE